MTTPKRCTRCGTLGEPYTYKGITFDGLTACEGERLCPTCRDRYLQAATPNLDEVPIHIGTPR